MKKPILSLVIALSCVLPSFANPAFYGASFQDDAAAAGVGKQLAYGAGKKALGRLAGGAAGLVGGTKRSDSHMLYMITPQFREARLAKFNKKPLKRRAKLAKKGLSAAEMKEMLKDAKYSLYESPSWDNGKDVIALVLRLDNKDLMHSNKSPSDINLLTGKKQSACNGSQAKKIKLTKKDKDYLNTLYNIDPHDEDWNALVKSYPADCFAKKKDKVKNFRVVFDYNGQKVNVTQKFPKTIRTIVKKDTRS